MSEIKNNTVPTHIKYDVDESLLSCVILLVLFIFDGQ
jgi:hypothetical protein